MRYQLFLILRSYRDISYWAQPIRSLAQGHKMLFLSTIEKHYCKVLYRKTFKVCERLATLETCWKSCMIKCNFSIAAISTLWESVMWKEYHMRNVLQGKSATWNNCSMKEYNVKSAQCEEKQRKKGNHENSKTRNS